MSFLFPPEIRSGLLLLRRRIRRIQLGRGLLQTASVALLGLLVIVALDYFLAPLPSLVRGGLFVIWLGAIVLASVCFLVIPLSAKLPLVRLARWLELRHPELQERISTTLELSDHPDGISPALLRELSEEAAADVGSLDPRAEVKSRCLRASLWPAAASLVAVVSLLVLWPQEMGRLLTRAVRPFSDLGNAGAFRFAVTPGDLEVLEGEEFTIEMLYTGELPEPLALVMDRAGEKVTESLEPESSEGETHRYAYTVYAAEEGFRYSALVGSNESDRFEVTVYPRPRLLEPMVEFDYPDYTGERTRKAGLGREIRALAGTTITLTGRLDTPITGGQMLLGETATGAVQLKPNAQGTRVLWKGQLTPGQKGTGSLSVTHRLGGNFEAARFGWIAEEDAAPQILILSPLKREFRLQPDDEIVLSYNAVEALGLTRAELEMEIDGRAVDSLPMDLPTRLALEGSDLWEGEARVSLGRVGSLHPKARVIRMRLALQDNRPEELEGPGIGYSDWLTVTLDRNAESMARQQLRDEEEDLRNTVEDVVKAVEQARRKVESARQKMQGEEEVSKRAQDELAAARDQLEEARQELADLSARMENGLQAHRRDEVAKAQDKLSEARKAVENAPLQDTPEARREELEHALRETQDAIADLKKLDQEVQQDRPKMDDLAKLQELARKQDELAREAARDAPDDAWEQRQREMREEIRNEVRESPEAKAAAIRAQAEQALELAREAGNLQEVQEELAEASPEVGRTPPTLDEAAIAEALASEQDKAAREAQQELTEARRNQKTTSPLEQAVSESRKAAQKARNSKPAEAAAAAREAAEQLTSPDKPSPTRQSLAEKQERLAGAFEALAEGRSDDAREALAELQSEPTLREIGEALAEAQKESLEQTREEWQEARRQNEERAENLARARQDAAEAVTQARQNQPGEAAQAARQAAEELAQGDERSGAQKSLQRKQEKLAEAFEAVAEGQAQKALEALTEAQGIPDPGEVAEALAEAQKGLVEETRQELNQARRDQEERADDLAQALKEASEAQSSAQKKQAMEAAEAARQAADQLSQEEQSPATQKSLQKKQEKLAEAFEALADGMGEEALAALQEAQNVPDPADVAQALAEAQQKLSEAAGKEQKKAQEAGEARAESLAEATGQARQAAREAQQNKPTEAAQAAREAAGQLAQGSETSPAQESLKNQQESLAEAFEALAEGQVDDAFEALSEVQSERLNEALGRALAKEQEAVVEAARGELSEAREALDPRANDLPEALAQARSALEETRQGDPAAAAQAAEAAAAELAKGSESSASQQQLQARQDGLAEALQDFAQGNPAAALAALQAMQTARAGDLAEAIREVAPVEGNPLSEAGQLAEGGAQKTDAASQAQQSGESAQAAREHQSAAEQFARARQSLESASQQMTRQAAQAAQESPNPNQAPAPGEPMAEALQRSSQAAQASQSGRSQEAAEQAQAAAQALRQAAQEARSQMQRGQQPGDPAAQANQPGEPGGESPPPDEAKEGVRQAQADQGVPPELAKLGINVEDWEKIQATLQTDVSGSGGDAIPEDYRGLVQKYFEQISKKQ